MFVLPFTRQECFNFDMSREDFRPVPPLAVVGVGLRHKLGISAVPTILGSAHFLRGSYLEKWRKRRTAHNESPDKLHEFSCVKITPVRSRPKIEILDVL